MSLTDYKPGDIIQSKCQPLFKVSKKSGEIGKICEECFTTFDSDLRDIPLQRCTGCRLVYYCSKVCQAKDWKNGHVIECGSKVFANNFRNKSIVDVRCQLFRAMSFLVMNPKMAEKQFDLHNGRSRCFNDLMSNQEFFEESALKEMCDEFALELEEVNLRKIGRVWIDSTYVLRLAGIIQTNGFTIYNEDETQELGSGIYIQASIFDHSCKPTALFKFKGGGIEIRAIAPIVKGEEPYISHISFHADKTERQRHLKARYNFVCRCERCECESNFEDQIDFKKFNACIDGMKSLTQDNSVAAMAMACSISQDRLLSIHLRTVYVMRQMYREYDDRIANQYSRALFALINTRTFKWTPKMEQFIQGAREHIKISSGVDHPEYLKFQRAIAVNT